MLQRWRRRLAETVGKLCAKNQERSGGSMNFNYGAGKKCQRYKIRTGGKACSGGLKDIMRDIVREIS
jgi:hypothetical protein